MSIVTRTATLVRQFEKNGYLPLLMLTVAIQGTVLISQTLASLLLPLEKTGAIRTFESVASVTILCASLGTQTLAVREIAAARNDEDRTRIFGELLALPFIGVGVLALVALTSLAMGRAPGGIGLASLLPAVALVLLVSMTRLLSGAAQGLFKVGAIYRSVIVGSGIAVVFHLFGALSGSITGWIIGRCLGEAALLAAVATSLAKAYPFLSRIGEASRRGIFKQLRTGISVNLALILRMTADALPIVMMGSASSALVIGQFGIATLALTLAILPIAVLTQLALPRLTAASSTEQKRAFRRLALSVFGGAIVLAAAASLLGIVVRPAMTPPVQASIVAVLVILWTLPLRSLALAFGSLSLARSNYFGPLAVNVFEVLAVISVMTIRPFGGTIWTSLVAVCIGAGVSLLGMIIQTLLIGTRENPSGNRLDEMAMVD
ncbi:hypothetical protein U1701_03235 [Sphingomonas sp. PB2P19]|uniref:hypothetical protein n=1 Tax=Sphingomonas rhamnosi TaxID=3096156 RepID=UPI002FC628C5